MSAAIQSVGMSEENAQMNNTMLEQFFTKVAKRKVEFLVENKNGRVEYVDEVAATIVCDDGVAEICIYGSVRWIG